MDKLKADVVVVGSGAAGWVAALTLAEGSAKVIVFERNEHIGGISNFPLGLFAVESKLQRKYGIPLTKDKVFKIFMEHTHWRADARLVKTFIDKTASTIEWLQQQGIEFEMWPLFQFPEAELTGHNVKLPGHFAGMLKILKSKAESLGVETYLSTPVKKLIKEADTITGVVAENKSGKKIIVDTRAVVIASGGFSDNKDMVSKYTGFEPGLDIELLSLGPPLEFAGNGIEMAWEAGAASDGMALQLICGLAARSGKLISWEQKTTGLDLSIIMNEPYLYPWINQDGVRFLDEGITLEPHYPANAVARQRNKCAYIIFDSDMKKYLEKETYKNAPPIVPPKTEVVDIDELIKKFHEMGDNNIFVANSLVDLGNQMCIDSDVLQRTIDEYNGFCSRGRDDLFNKNPKYLRTVKQPKFYAFRIKPMATGTIGGIKINERAEAVNIRNGAIPGLYAAGDCANGAISYDFWLAHALAGNPSSFAVNTGRIAGENALKYIDKDQKI